MWVFFVGMGVKGVDRSREFVDDVIVGIIFFFDDFVKMDFSVCVEVFKFGSWFFMVVGLVGFV